jgi:serine/threonine protein kinase/tetratricopeptide (TPR) repeat protein
MTSGSEIDRGSRAERPAEEASGAGPARPRLESGELAPGDQGTEGAAALVVPGLIAPVAVELGAAPTPEALDLGLDTDPSRLEVSEDSAPPSIPSAASLASAELMSADSDAAESRAAPVLPGHVLADRYEILNVLGEGGMGIVYRCRDQATNEIVAIKRVILPDGQGASDYIMWFYKEARALAVLSHPVIVRARDFGQLIDGSPYLAMDLAHGLSLHELSQVRLSFPVIWSIVDQILSALAHAHARGIVHGDLKPSNVLVEEREEEPPSAHILDFGLAWLKQDPHDERLDGEKAMEFAPHAGAGTPGYMAPEQIQHETHHVCGATDLYALGCILYRMLSGRTPFSGDAKELLKLHAFEPTPMPRLSADAPEGVGAFVMRLLEKRPWDRWEFAAEARGQWALFRPGADVKPAAWRFPALRRPSQQPPAPTTRKTGPRGPNPDLKPAPQRAPGLLSIRPSPLVGRADIRRVLREVCDDVIESEGPPHRLVLLVGPAGVGKSRIAEWLCEVVHEEGTMMPLKARYRPMRGPLDGMLGAAMFALNFERADRDAIERSLLERWKVPPNDKSARSWVAGAAEWFRPLPPGQEHAGPSGLRFTLDTLEVRRAVIRYTLRRIANGRPLLFWLDDLHHAGAATFEGLLKIHSDEPDIRIVMLATVRAEDVQLGTPAAERLRNLREKMDGAVLDIKPLDADTTATLLHEALPLDEAAVREAARRSRGNPLFALQQLHAWALAGNMEFKDGVYKVPPEVLAVRPATTAELWDSRVAAMPIGHRLSAYAAATLGTDIRRNVLHALLTSLGQSADRAITSLQSAEIILPRGPDRYSWPHALLMEHLLMRLGERDDRRVVYRAAADALAHHPLAGTRRVVRQRVANLLSAGLPDTAAALLFDFLERSWNGAREPLATLMDLDLLKGQLEGQSLALKHRWQAEALRHVGRTEEAMTHVEIARNSFEDLGDQENLSHCLRLLGNLSSERGASAEGLLLVNLAHQLFEQLGNVAGMAQCEAVAGEIEYLLGNYESARRVIQAGESHFAVLDQPLGHGQCLLLLSWMDHSEGATERSRRLTLQARAEFDRAGYRLGTAQADTSLAHVDHRLMNFHSAELGALDALSAFESLRTPRGQAACQRLLAMVGVDTDDVDMAELHAERALAIYEVMGDPWGILESKLLLCQVALACDELESARALLAQCAQLEVEEAEPRQHHLLTRAWLEILSGDADRAFECIEAAAEVFGPISRAGDHTPHLLGRLSRLTWPEHARGRIDAWRALLNDRARRMQE